MCGGRALPGLGSGRRSARRISDRRQRLGPREGHVHRVDPPPALLHGRGGRVEQRPHPLQPPEPGPRPHQRHFIKLLTGVGDNGGPTLTHLPTGDSPAIDAGDNASCPVAGSLIVFHERNRLSSRMGTTTGRSGRNVPLEIMRFSASR